MAFVQVGGDDDLEPVAPHLSGQLHANLMAQFRGDFTRLETLIAMPCDIFILLAYRCLVRIICRSAVCFRQLMVVTKEPSAVFCGF